VDCAKCTIGESEEQERIPKKNLKRCVIVVRQLKQRDYATLVINDNTNDYERRKGQQKGNA
jgi:hypothetical protein